MIKKIIFLLLILLLISGCKKQTTGTIEVIYPSEYNNGAVIINEQGYPCGWEDNICPNDYSPQKPVCKKIDPDC